MRLEPADIEGLRPLVELLVSEVVEKILIETAKFSADRLAYSENEAAQLLGVDRQVLGAARRRGDLTAVKLGRSWRYGRAQLIAWLSTKKEVSSRKAI